MAFIDQFRKYYSDEERGTELYQLWSAIGANMEKAMMEEFNRLIANYEDINVFDTDVQRSWLAFFLKKIPYRISAVTTVTARLTSVPNGTVVIPQYSTLRSTDGKIYTQLEQMIFMNQNDINNSRCVQGQRITETGIYDGIIKVQANNPDLSYITLTLNGKEIPEVSYATSFDTLHYKGQWSPSSFENYGGYPKLDNQIGTKGDFYSVTEDGSASFTENGTSIVFSQGDVVVYTGNGWQKLVGANQINPINYAEQYAIPYNGYYAYYYNGYLYVKVFGGTEVPKPQGMSYSLTYISSDGSSGEIDADVLIYNEVFNDGGNSPMDFEISNIKSSSAINEPSQGKLGLHIKERLYSSINVSSIPEYTWWFKSQPEVGDCLILSDWERYLMTGQYNLTGVVSAYLVDSNANPLTADMKTTLMKRLSEVKDIAYVEFPDLINSYQALEFTYTSSSDNNLFEQFVKTTTLQWYNIEYLQKIGDSLFTDLDLSKVISDILNNTPYNVNGLSVKGYHYQTLTATVSDTPYTILGLEGEQPGDAKYIVSDGEQSIELSEILVPGTTNQSNIYTPTGMVCGSRVGNEITINLISVGFTSGTTVTVQCYLGMKNEGTITVGGSKMIRRISENLITVKRS